MKCIVDKKGITLVALVVTIILLLILAGVSIMTLTGSGLFEKAILAEQKSTHKQEEEEQTLKDYENKIGEYVDGTRQTTNKKSILWKTGETPTKEVQLDEIDGIDGNVKNYDFIVVYYETFNTAGNILFDTSETAKYMTNYTYGESYIFAGITLDIDDNSVVIVESGNNSSWNAGKKVFLTKIIGIKL